MQLIHLLVFYFEVPTKTTSINDSTHKCSNGTPLYRFLYSFIKPEKYIYISLIKPGITSSTVYPPLESEVFGEKLGGSHNQYDNAVLCCCLHTIRARLNILSGKE